MVTVSYLGNLLGHVSFSWVKRENFFHNLVRGCFPSMFLIASDIKCLVIMDARNQILALNSQNVMGKFDQILSKIRTMKKMTSLNSLMGKVTDNSRLFGLPETHFRLHNSFTKFFTSIGASISLLCSLEYKVDGTRSNNIMNQLNNLLHSKLILNTRVSSNCISIYLSMT